VAITGIENRFRGTGLFDLDGGVIDVKSFAGESP
jgi:hypothetical protein